MIHLPRDNSWWIWTAQSVYLPFKHIKVVSFPFKLQDLLFSLKPVLLYFTVYPGSLPFPISSLFLTAFLVCRPPLPPRRRSPPPLLSACDRSMLYPFGFPLQLYSPGNWAQLVSQGGGGGGDFHRRFEELAPSSVTYIITRSIHLLQPVKPAKTNNPTAVIGLDSHLQCHLSHRLVPG